MISDGVIVRVADGDASAADAGAISDSISRIGELELPLARAIELLARFLPW